MRELQTTVTLKEIDFLVTFTFDEEVPDCREPDSWWFESFGGFDMAAFPPEDFRGLYMQLTSEDEDKVYQHIADAIYDWFHMPKEDV